MATTSRVMPIRSGFVTFAGVLGFILGVFNVLSGIAAIAEDDRTERLGDLLYGVNITAWGWFWLIIGILQIATGWLIIQRKPLGLWMGVLWASISAMFTVFVIWVEPFWALAVLALDVGILYGLIMNAEEFEG
jgi:hypothetical protein